MEEGNEMSAGSVEAARPERHWAGGGSTPTSALQSLRVLPVPICIAKTLLVREHYLHSMPGGTRLAFGVMCAGRLQGALTLGAGPKSAHRLVSGTAPHDCATLTRLWLSDEVPRNSESRVLGVVLRALKRNTSLRFLITYADPAKGHLGTIYQATGWDYIGESRAVPLIDLGDGVGRHTRSLGHAFGTHSTRHFAANGIPVRLIPQAPKHRYLYFLDPSWRRLATRPFLPYPKKETS